MMAVLSKLVYGVKATLYQNAYCLFCCVEIDNLILKLIWKYVLSRKAKTFLKTNKVQGLALPDFETYRNNQEIVVLE